MNNTRKNNNSGDVIAAWINEVNGLEHRLSKAIEEFTNVSSSYEEMRNKSSNAKTNGKYNKEKADLRKEQIDQAYNNLYNTKIAFCNLKAGGKRSLTRRKK
jgi:regulator of replication initiation timing